MKSVIVQTVLLIVSVVFVHPEAGAVGTTHRVSVDADELEVDGASDAPALSADRRVVWAG